RRGRERARSRRRRGGRAEGADASDDLPGARRWGRTNGRRHNNLGGRGWPGYNMGPLRPYISRSSHPPPPRHGLMSISLLRTARLLIPGLLLAVPAEVEAQSQGQGSGGGGRAALAPASAPAARMAEPP